MMHGQLDGSEMRLNVKAFEQYRQEKRDQLTTQPKPTKETDK
jgi:hypothetical protein